MLGLFKILKSVVSYRFINCVPELPENPHLEGIEGIEGIERWAGMVGGAPTFGCKTYTPRERVRRNKAGNWK